MGLTVGDAINPFGPHRALLMALSWLSICTVQRANSQATMESLTRPTTSCGEAQLGRPPPHRDPVPTERHDRRWRSILEEKFGNSVPVQAWEQSPPYQSLVLFR